MTSSVWRMFNTSRILSNKAPCQVLHHFVPSCQFSATCHKSSIMSRRTSPALLKYTSLPCIEQTRTLVDLDPDYTPQNAKDGVARRYKLIYASRFRKQMAAGYLFVGATLVPVFSMSAKFAFENFGNIIEALSTIEGMGLVGYAGAPFGIMLLGFFRFAFSKLVLRIYYDENSETFIGVKYNGLLQLKTFKYKTEDVTDVSNETFTVLGKEYFIKTDDFKLPLYYNIMLGYVREDEEEK